MPQRSNHVRNAGTVRSAGIPRPSKIDEALIAGLSMRALWAPLRPEPHPGAPQAEPHPGHASEGRRARGRAARGWAAAASFEGLVAGRPSHQRKAEQSEDYPRRWPASARSRDCWSWRSGISRPRQKSAVRIQLTLRRWGRGPPQHRWAEAAPEEPATAEPRRGGAARHARRGGAPRGGEPSRQCAGRGGARRRELRRLSRRLPAIPVAAPATPSAPPRTKRTRTHSADSGRGASTCFDKREPDQRPVGDVRRSRDRPRPADKATSLPGRRSPAIGGVSSVAPS